MSEENSDIGRVADAAKEVAKATGKAIPSIEKLGHFLYRVIGEPVELLSGTFITDPLKEYRVRRLSRLQCETEAVLARRGSDGTRKVPPKTSVPLLENASLEDDDDLQILWARLLASAMDNNEPEVDAAFPEVLKSLNPKDVGILNGLSDGSMKFTVSATHDTYVMAAPGKRFAVKREGFEPDLKASTEKLEALGLIKAVQTVGGLRLDAAKQSILLSSLEDGRPITQRQLVDIRLDHTADVYGLTEFGRAFLKAVRG